MPTKAFTGSDTEQTLVERNDARTAIAIQNGTQETDMSGDAVVFISDEKGKVPTEGYAIPAKGYFVIEFNEGFDPRKAIYVACSTNDVYITVFEAFLKTKTEVDELPIKEDIQDKYPHDPPM